MALLPALEQHHITRQGWNFHMDNSETRWSRGCETPVLIEGVYRSVVESVYSTRAISRYALATKSARTYPLSIVRGFKLYLKLGEGINKGKRRHL
jgi:hypothetical protein